MSSIETIFPQVGFRAPRISKIAAALFRRISFWAQVSRTRRQLGELTPAELKDIGLSRETALHEADRVFWDNRFQRSTRLFRSSP